VRDGTTDFFKAGKIPEVWKIPALLWLYWLHRTVPALEKNTFAIRLVLQGKALAIPAQVKKRLDEIKLTQTLKSREARDFLIGQTHLSRPPAAGSTTFALVKNWHVR
jgi:hypothetical protein